MSSKAVSGGQRIISARQFLAAQRSLFRKLVRNLAVIFGRRHTPPRICENRYICAKLIWLARWHISHQFFPAPPVSNSVHTMTPMAPFSVYTVSRDARVHELQHAHGTRHGHGHGHGHGTHCHGPPILRAPVPDQYDTPRPSAAGLALSTGRRPSAVSRLMSYAAAPHPTQNEPK